MISSPILVYLPDPFSVRPAVFWLRLSDGTEQRITASDVGALDGPLITLDLPALIDELRRAGKPPPKHPVDIADALRLIVGLPRDEGGERQWDVWLRLRQYCEEPKAVQKFRALFKSQSVWPDDETITSLMSVMSASLAGLWNWTVKGLQSAGEWERFEKVEVPVQAIFAARQYSGLAVDPVVAEDLLQTLTDEKYKAFVAIAGAINASPTGINFWNVSPHLPRTDAADIGETDGGRLRDAFRLASHRSTFARDFLRFIDASQDETILRRTAGLDERLHPTFAVLGTVSGRILVSDPLLQQLRRRYRGIVAPDAGKQLIYLDYAQFEPGVLAFLSEDAELLAAYNGGDLYTGLAEAVFADANARPIAKRMFLAFSYGMSAESVAGLITAPGDAALRSDRAAIVTGFFGKFPGLHSYRERMERALAANGRISTLAGNFRCRSQEGRLSAKERRWAVNQPIQGTAALIFKEALIKLADEFGSASILLPVHDAALMQFDADDAFDDRVNRAKEIMRVAFEARCHGVKARITAGAFSD